MLCACLNTTLLHTKNRFVRAFTRQERIRTKSFPVPPALCEPSYVHHWAERNVYTFASMFASHEQATRTQERAVPSVQVEIGRGKPERIHGQKVQ